jgi:hypothetical protein
MFTCDTEPASGTAREFRSGRHGNVTLSPLPSGTNSLQSSTGEHAAQHAQASATILIVGLVIATLSGAQRGLAASQSEP